MADDGVALRAHAGASSEVDRMRHPRRTALAVKVGRVTVGGSAPIVVQSMTNTDTADIEGTAQQIKALARAG